MKKILLLILLVLLLAPVIPAQDLTSADIVSSFKIRMKSDLRNFPDSVIYQLVNFGTGLACDFGFAYQKVDTLVLATATERYALSKPAIWVYKAGKLGAGERAWQSVKLKDMGKVYFKEALAPAYYEFYTEFQAVTSTFSAGTDSTYFYCFPKPTSADNGDSVIVHYFAWTDTINANVKGNYRDVILHLTLMGGYFRQSKTDKAVEEWNKASGIMSKLRNDWLMRIYDIEVAPKAVGGR